ncbi:MAG: hypothetical protein KDA84_20280, partial [Planctomycetaceae bacterium]|nr:hypothetical protein [Planctomycetaceae bacterium]
LQGHHNGFTHEKLPSNRENSCKGMVECKGLSENRNGYSEIQFGPNTTNSSENLSWKRDEGPNPLERVLPTDFTDVYSLCGVWGRWKAAGSLPRSAPQPPNKNGRFSDKLPREYAWNQRKKVEWYQLARVPSEEPVPPFDAEVLGRIEQLTGQVMAYTSK